MSRCYIDKLDALGCLSELSVELGRFSAAELQLHGSNSFVDSNHTVLLLEASHTMLSTRVHSPSPSDCMKYIRNKTTKNQDS